MAQSLAENSSATAVLVKATLRAASLLGLNQAELSRVVGLSAASVTRLKDGSMSALGGKERECALYLVRIFRSLDALMGGNEARVRAWFDAFNYHLHGKPRELVATIGGLTGVAEYLDAMRGNQ